MRERVLPHLLAFPVVFVLALGANLLAGNAVAVHDIEAAIFGGGAVERPLAGMAERGMAEVVGERQRLREVLVQPELPGQRECIIPRDGYLFCSIDLDSAEMRGFAQHALEHLGWSELADALNAGLNPHRLLGSDILRCAYPEFDERYKAGDPEAKRAAQFAKIPNFALLGGGGWRILPDYAKGMGIVLADSEAQHLAELFHARWREVKPMHTHYKGFIHDVFEQPITRRLRYYDRYAQACNGQFQARIADAAGLGVVRLAEEMYVPGGQLMGSYTVLHLHDENLIEIPEHCASEHAWRATKIMIDAANVFLPDVPMTAKPALMRRFSKGADHVVHESKRDSDGNPLLLVCET